MGKKIISQRRGRGTSTFRAPSHRYKVKALHKKYDEKEKEGVIKGKIVDILKDPARTAPVAEVLLENNEKINILAVEGIKVGDEISFGGAAEIVQGNTLPLGKIPEGTPVNNVEAIPGDGGKYIRSSGVYGLVIAHDDGRTVVQMPSGELKTLDSDCRATIGIVAGGGRREKPILKAGKRWHMIRSKAKYWPIVRKVAMNPVDHPHGGGSRRPGKPTTVSRNLPPGAKVGLIAAKRAGRK
jgi:large subunit ribosomal protein L2